MADGATPSSHGVRSSRLGRFRGRIQGASVAVKHGWTGRMAFSQFSGWPVGIPRALSTYTPTTKKTAVPSRDRNRNSCWYSAAGDALPNRRHDRAGGDHLITVWCKEIPESSSLANFCIGGSKERPTAIATAPRAQLPAEVFGRCHGDPRDLFHESVYAA
ncbi:hypothetical protein GGTG_03794 [Gaeumannomyces tritici R3-111a-1]|uniref:Uncharacterized protein n=1 Tax=Gaeumannomyces tritici (strain R3-111a-1) TaxID=644352 RepID=J3NR89_GAET3|nr:hypothetical protein GGTG_03794 [Gaeumannomyces tritici R3-111a-1]EJT78695.1 hypothetical protein GGTG_03794 [Gaeumannomyces tritici R3-111a-1]